MVCVSFLTSVYFLFEFCCNIFVFVLYFKVVCLVSNFGGSKNILSMQITNM